MRVGTYVVRQDDLLQAHLQRVELRRQAVQRVGAHARAAPLRAAAAAAAPALLRAAARRARRLDAACGQRSPSLSIHIHTCSR